jgi:uncharacterized protein (TIGR02678 family)
MIPITKVLVAQPDNSRRARLARLREEAEPLVAGERRAALRALLQRPLLTPDGAQAEEFALVRRHREWLATWFAHHANWSLSVTAEVARLRKVPAITTDPSRGALDERSEELFTRTRYVLLCLALAALERSDRQITLGRLAEAVTNALAADPGFAEAGFLWSLDKTAGRRDFVHALRLLLTLGVLRRVQGDEERFLHDRGSDALYNVARPVLAVLLACRRSPSLVSATDLDGQLSALLDEHAHPETPESQNRALRTWLVRRLLDDPVLYYRALSPENRSYLDRQRGFLLPELAEATGFEPEVRAEGMALADVDGDCTDVGLPEEGTEGHLTLLLATWLAGQLRETRGAPSALVTEEAVRQQTARLIRKHRHHWRKEATQKGADAWLTQLVIGRLAGLSLIERHVDGIVPLPALGRYALRPSHELAEGAETEPLQFDP